MCHTIKAILFDHDGTLVDSEKIHFKLWATVLERYNIIFKKDDYIRHYAGIPTSANAERLVKTYSLKIPAQILIQEKNSLTDVYLADRGFPLMPGAEESLSHFQHLGIKMAVVTGAGIDGVKVTINRNNLKGYFSTVVSSDDVERSKPAPDLYLLAMKKLEVKSSECIAIEDTENGILSAVSANIRCVGISSTMSQYHDFSNAIKTFNNLREATRWITDYIKPINTDPRTMRAG